MAQESLGNRQAFADKVRESVRHVESQASRLRAIYTRLLVFSVVNTAATTLVTGFTAAQGPFIGEGPTGWRVSCIIAAVLGFAATLSIGLNQQLRLSERLSEANLSLGRLRYLDVAIATGTREWDHITQEYQDILRLYPEALR